MIKKVEIEGRRWYEDEHGRYPSASSVLDILFPNGKDFVPEDALARGTLCHAEISKALLARVQHHTYQPHEEPQIAKRIAAALKFLDEHIIEIIAFESPSIFMNIGLTSDFVGKGKNNHTYLWDWKFAEGVQERYIYQADLYQRAEKCDRASIIQITRDGEVIPHKVKEDARRWELIKSAINVRHFLDEKIKRVI